MKESVRYLGVAETARLMRTALKNEFRATKFSVRSKSYSGGASINVRWCDGPTVQTVRKITQQFSGGGFDGMIDMAFNYEHWLLPDGSAVIAYSPGTEGSRGVYAAIKTNRPHDDAELVSFAANHVFEDRKISLEFARKAAAKVASYYGVEAPELVGGTSIFDLWAFAEPKDADKNASGEVGWFGGRGTWRECIRRAAEDATEFTREEVT